MKKKTIPLLLAACFLILATLLVRDKISERKHTRGETLTGQVSASAEPILPDGARSAKRSIHKTSSLPSASHDYAQLKDFIIPELKLEDASFTQALHQLNNEYNRICRLTGERPIVMKFDTQHVDHHLITLTFTNLSFTSMLKTLSSIAGVTHEQNQNTHVFSPIKKHGHAFTRAFPVTPNMAHKLGIAQKDADDPFVDESSPKITVRERIKELLRLPKNESCIVSYIPASERVIVRADLSDLNRIGILFDNFLMAPPTQLRVMSKLISFDSEKIDERFTIPQTQTAMSEADVHKFFNNAARTRGTDIMTLPSVIARPGEKATIEVIREIILPSPTNPQKSSKDWTGVKMHIHPSLMGFGTMTNPALDLGELDPTSSSVTHHEMGQQTFVTHGNTMLYSYNHPEGKKLLLIVTHQEIDPTGKIIEKK